MRKTVWVVVVVMLLGALLLTACGGGGGGGDRPEVPAEFASLTNPFEGDAAAATEGQALYTTNCASCHGDTAQGDGPVGSSLDPKPANLATTAQETEPPYSHWVITKGGAAAGLSSSMVAYEGILSDDDVWKIVTYLESTYGQ